MGCTPSRTTMADGRPISARSWMASDGWIIGEPMKQAPLPPTHQSHDGRIVFNDSSKERDLTGEESPYEPPATRDLIGIPPSVGITTIVSPWQAQIATGEPPDSFQDERTIVEILRSLRPGQNFSDPDFPPNDSSLFYSDRHDPQIEWHSPKDLSPQPSLFVDGINRSDIMQGSLGDCWFLSSCAAVCQKKELMDKILPDRQVLAGPDYKGVVRVRFWRFGRWIDAYVDDKLPTKDGRLIYAHDTDPNEFWVSLLEKAYAKLHGSYEAIEGGQSMDALVDLTGGIAERYELTEHTQDLYLKLSRAASAGSFVTCSRKGNWKSTTNEVDENGLVAGHAYTVSAVRRIKRVNGTECLLRIRNPWGYGEEWRGAWSDKDHRWQLVDAQTKKELQFVEKGDGEFWMCFKDFCQNFQEVTICTVGPDFDGDGVADAAGQILIAYGRWKSNLSAGGCRNDLKSFATNPQFLLTVYESDEQDHGLLPHERRKSTCSVIVALMQEHRRVERHVAVKLLQLGFIIYKTDTPDNRLPVEHFTYNYETAKSGTYVNFREVCGRFELEPGHYVIIPSTYNKEEPGDFMIRVFARMRIALSELPEFGSPAAIQAPPTSRKESQMTTDSVSSSRKPSKLEYDHHIVPPAVTEPMSNHHPFDPSGSLGEQYDWEHDLPPARSSLAGSARISAQRRRSMSFNA